MEYKVGGTMVTKRGTEIKIYEVKEFKKVIQITGTTPKVMGGGVKYASVRIKK
jgi:hypothetical protein